MEGVIGDLGERFARDASVTQAVRQAQALRQARHDVTRVGTRLAECGFAGARCHLWVRRGCAPSWRATVSMRAARLRRQSASRPSSTAPLRSFSKGKPAFYSHLPSKEFFRRDRRARDLEQRRYAGLGRELSNPTSPVTPENCTRSASVIVLENDASCRREGSPRRSH
jgi:hypothetical protein